MSDPRANLGPPSLVPVPPERRATATGEEIIPVTAENLVAGKIPLAAYLAVQHQLAARARKKARAERLKTPEEKTKARDIFLRALGVAQRKARVEAEARTVARGDNIRLGDLALRVQEVWPEGELTCCALSPRRPDLIAGASDRTAEYMAPTRCGRDQFLVFPKRGIDTRPAT